MKQANGQAAVTVALAAVALLIAAFAPAATHVVVAAGFDFTPQELTIAAGDTVLWSWGDGLHTVTSGSSLTDPALGDLFDAPLDQANQEFRHVFTSAGDVPYLCQFHYVLGMTGVIHVTGGVSAQSERWGHFKTLYR